jgi:hypothetical protein
MVKASQNVPATALSNYVGGWPATGLIIGTSWVPFNGVYNVPSYWFVAVDLTDLSIYQNVVSSDPNNVPAAIQALLGNTRYFLFFIANYQFSPNIVQGSLYTFLQAVGAGPQLARGEQMIEQLGTGMIRYFSYVLAATCDDTDMPGFEVFNDADYAVLTMQFMPVTVNGQTVYAPVQTS